MPEKIINRDRPKKLYVQVLEAIREEIENGKWPVGFQIPVEDELCQKYEVSKATIRLAVLDLARQGYLIRHQGRGTFVCKKASPLGMTMTTDFDELMLEAISPLSIKVLVQTIMTPVDDLEEKLDLSGENHVIYIRRLVSAGNDPFLLAESYILHRLCPELLREDINNRPLLEVLEKKYQIPITRIEIFIDVVYATENEVMLLDIPIGAPLLLLEQHFYARDTQVMYMRSVKRADRSRFSCKYEKK